MYRLLQENSSNVRLFHLFAIHCNHEEIVHRHITEHFFPATTSHLRSSQYNKTLATCRDVGDQGRDCSLARRKYKKEVSYRST